MTAENSKEPIEYPTMIAENGHEILHYGDGAVIDLSELHSSDQAEQSNDRRVLPPELGRSALTDTIDSVFISQYML